MIRHAIMWKFVDEHDGLDKDGIMQKLEGEFDKLKSIIPQIRSMKLERDILRSERSFDMIYITEFDSLDDLEIYKNHPEHLKVADYVKQVRAAQAVTDSQIQ